MIILNTFFWNYKGWKQKVLETFFKVEMIEISNIKVLNDKLVKYINFSDHAH